MIAGKQKGRVQNSHMTSESKPRGLTSSNPSHRLWISLPLHSAPVWRPSTLAMHREQGYVAVMVVFPGFSSCRHPIAECALSSVLNVLVPELYEVILSEGETLAQIRLVELGTKRWQRKIFCVSQEL